MTEDELVHQYLPLVRAIAGHIAMTLPANVDVEDLHSAGCVGLMQAIRRYDCKREVRFKTYAWTRIRGAIYDDLRRWLHRPAREGPNASHTVYLAHEAIADTAQANPGRIVERGELVNLLVARLKRLPRMQRVVLALYYFEDLRLREIAEVFGVTESRICQVHAAAITSIRTFVHRIGAI